MVPPPRHLPNLLPDTCCLGLRRIQEQDGRIAISAEVKLPTARCPTCQRSSSRLHSRYSRTLRDLPWQGAVVDLHLEVRRFRCRSHDCPRKTFVERLPIVMASHSRQTARLAETLRMIGYTLGGEAGARLANRLGIETSADTVLRRIKRLPGITEGAPVKILGVDDWAWRKGQRYGTILVDLERHVPIDLLADRSAESLESWLEAHPGVEVISRDRAGVYAEGASKGAPKAIQVADRFHLLCNLTSAVERSLESKRAVLRSAINDDLESGATSPAQPETANANQRTRSEQRKEERRQRRLERYTQVLELYGQGMSQNEISRTLQLERKTVRRYLRAGKFPERARPRRRPPEVAKYRDYLEARWKEGCHNATQLWHEIEKQGYSGKRSMVARLVSSFRSCGTKYFREQAVPAKQKRRDISPRQAAMLMARQPENLTEDQQNLVAKLAAHLPEIATMHRLMKGFSVLLRERRLDDFQKWSDDVAASGLPEMKRFCDGLERDRTAVNAAILLPWSNGQVEGQVHRLKLIKRQMYGRAGFPLLRNRVLPFCPAPGVRVFGRSP